MMLLGIPQAGPSFRGITSFTFDQHNDRMAAKADLQKALIMQHKSRYLINPATIDTSLRLASMVPSRGQTETVKSHAPVYIENISFLVCRLNYRLYRFRRAFLHFLATLLLGPSRLAFNTKTVALL
jgi:hypothetical protein